MESTADNPSSVNCTLAGRSVEGYDKGKITLASRFIRTSLRAQQNSAQVLLKALKPFAPKCVYVYVKSPGHFTQNRMIGNLYRISKHGDIAVLCSIAQQIFLDSNQYLKFSEDGLGQDKVGVFVTSSTPAYSDSKVHLV